MKKKFFSVYHIVTSLLLIFSLILFKEKIILSKISLIPTFFLVLTLFVYFFAKLEKPAIDFKYNGKSEKIEKIEWSGRRGFSPAEASYAADFYSLAIPTFYIPIFFLSDGIKIPVGLIIFFCSVFLLFLPAAIVFGARENRETAKKAKEQRALIEKELKEQLEREELGKFK